LRPGLQLLGSLLHRSQPLLALQDLGVELVFGSVHDVLDVVGLELLPSYKQIFVSAHLTLRVGPSSQFGVGRRGVRRHDTQHNDIQHNDVRHKNE